MKSHTTLVSICINGLLVSLLELRMVNMPDLSDSEQISEQRKTIKFWIDHCHSLEDRIEDLKCQLKMAVEKDNA